jgi:putative membrane protein
MKTTTYFIIALCAILTTGCNKDKSADSKEMAEEENADKFKKSDESDDAKFAVEAADGGMLEVQLGELAMKNGSSAKVKEFGQQMVTDHGKGNAQLKALAEQKGISIPTVLSDKCQKKLDELSAKQGADFDKAYADLMVKDHKDDIDEFRKESEKGNDAEIKAWAGETLPVLEHHLQMAEGMKDGVK